MLKRLIHRAILTLSPQGAIITPRAHGIDISKYDQYFYYAQVTGQLDFIIQRASYRTTRDQLFDFMVGDVMSIPIRGAYHYLNSDTGWAAQADKFLTVVSPHNFHFYVCDFESAVNVMSTAFARSAWDFIQYVRSETGKPVLLYTSPSIYNSYITPSARAWESIPLWNAQWNYTPNPNGTPKLPTGRTTWKIWQYTDSGMGKDLYGVARNGACDLNVYNGSVAEMRAWLGVGGSTPPPAGDVDTPFPGVTRVRSDGVQVLTIAPDSIERVEIV